jgi:hypothetical protein
MALLTNNSAASAPVVLYVGGEGRSGSTVLSTLLGRQPGWTAVGELRGIWSAVQTNELCGCGEQFDRCPFWTAVGETAFGGWHRLDVDTLLRQDTALNRHRHLGRQVIPALRRQHRGLIKDHSAVLGKLYRAIRSVGDARVIVDSSKDATYAWLLRGSQVVDLRLVHLVRDSRGVAYSWGKRRVDRPEYARHPTLAGTFMDSRTPSRAAAEWTVKNGLLQVLRMGGTRGVRVKYEALACKPNAVLDCILTLVDDVESSATSDQAMPPKTGTPPLTSTAQHSIGGNRVRFDHGAALKLNLDDEWQRGMTPAARRVVTAWTLPLLVAYGYPIRVDEPRPKVATR